MKFLSTRVLSIILAVLMIFSATACSNSETNKSTSGNTNGGNDSGEVRTIQVGHVNPSKEDDQFQKYGTMFKKNLEEVSGGKFVVEVMGDAQLGGDRDMLEGLQMGTLDMGLISNFTVGLFSPVFQVFNLPYIFEDAEQAAEIFDNKEIMKPLTEELYNTCNIQLLSMAEGGFRYMLNNERPIKTVADMKGLKMRLPETPTYVDSFKAWGSNPTTMAYTETFAAVQQGTVDGLEIPLGSILSSGYHEINKYLSLTEHFSSPIAVMVSKNVWDSLSDEEKAWFNEAATKTTVEHREFMKEIQFKYLEEIKKSGIEVNGDVNKAEFREAAQSVYDDYIAEFGPEIIDQIK